MYIKLERLITLVYYDFWFGSTVRIADITLWYITLWLIILRYIGFVKITHNSKVKIQHPVEADASNIIK